MNDVAAKKQTGRIRKEEKSRWTLWGPSREFNRLLVFETLSIIPPRRVVWTLGYYECMNLAGTCMSNLDKLQRGVWDGENHFNHFAGSSDETLAWLEVCVCKMEQRGLGGGLDGNHGPPGCRDGHDEDIRVVSVVSRRACMRACVCAIAYSQVLSPNCQKQTACVEQVEARAQMLEILKLSVR